MPTFKQSLRLQLRFDLSKLYIELTSKEPQAKVGTAPSFPIFLGLIVFSHPSS